MFEIHFGSLLFGAFIGLLVATVGYLILEVRRSNAAEGDGADEDDSSGSAF